MSIFQKIGNVTSATAKFMARYADEASSIADIFRAIMPAIPINQQDKNKVFDVINQLDGVADRIADFLNENPNVGEPVKVKASDVQAAIDKYLLANPSVIEAAVANVIARNTELLGGNGNVT